MIRSPADVSIREMAPSCSRSCTPPTNWSQSTSGARMYRAFRSFCAIVRWITRGTRSPPSVEWAPPANDVVTLCRVIVTGSPSIIEPPCGTTHSETTVPSGPTMASTPMSSRTPSTHE